MEIVMSQAQTQQLATESEDASLIIQPEVSHLITEDDEPVGSIFSEKQ
jgi:hypothetical protein